MSIDKIPPSSGPSLLRSTSILSAGTLLSRILGFVRDVIFALFFGTNAGADAFVVAFRLPNMLRDLAGEGAANAAFIPVLTEYKEKRPHELREFVNAVVAWAVIILTALVLVGILFAPLVVRMIAPGFVAEPGKMALAVHLTQLMFPYLIFIGLTAFFAAIQFAYGSFVMPALGPCILNVVLITSTIISVRCLGEPLYGLAVGVLAGGALQLWFQWVPLKRFGITLGSPFRLNHAGARQVGKLVVPRLFGAGVYQANVFVDTLCASLVSIVGPGGVSAIYYATRIEQLPMGVFGVALASAALPRLSREALSADKIRFRETVVGALKNVFFIMLPMTITLVLLAEPVVRILFERGAFGAYSTQVTAGALKGFALGLMGYGGVKILVGAFYALQDTKTPVKIAGMALVVNVILNLTLMFSFKVAGIALASAVSAYVSMYMLFRILSPRVGGFSGHFDGFWHKLLLAGALQAVVVWGLWGVVTVTLIGKLLIIIPAGAVVYLLAGYVLKIEPARQLERLWQRSR